MMRDFKFQPFSQGNPFDSIIRPFLVRMSGDLTWLFQSCFPNSLQCGSPIHSVSSPSFCPKYVCGDFEMSEKGSRPRLGRWEWDLCKLIHSLLTVRNLEWMDEDFVFKDSFFFSMESVLKETWFTTLPSRRKTVQSFQIQEDSGVGEWNPCEWVGMTRQC